MTEISFTSKLVPVKSSDFHKITSKFNPDNYVDYPWTIATSRIGKNVFTEGICDCTSCLIKDGNAALLMHLNPSDRRNRYFNNVLEFLRNNIDLKNEKLQAVLIGSKNTPKSLDIWNKFIDLLDYLNIPTTILRNGKNPTHMAYNNYTDEVLISNYNIDTMLKKNNTLKDALINSFEEVKISDYDEIQTLPYISE